MTDFGKEYTNSMPALEQLQYIGNTLALQEQTSKPLLCVVSLHLNARKANDYYCFMYIICNCVLLLGSWSHNCNKLLLEQLMIIMPAAYIP